MQISQNRSKKSVMHPKEEEAVFDSLNTGPCQTVEACGAMSLTVHRGM